MGGSVNDRQPPWPNLSAQVTGVRGRREAGGLDVGELTTPSDSNFPRLGLPALPVGDLPGLVKPRVSALACIFKDRRRHAGCGKNHGALRYHDPIALRAASRVTVS